MSAIRRPRSRTNRGATATDGNYEGAKSACVRQRARRRPIGTDGPCAESPVPSVGASCAPVMNAGSGRIPLCGA